ncbi:hypothetical protein VE03_10477 [Pseudogymnoascus sp. 23342-1-I1]|nr:hypothetical protein VE03_10477 [Pseudogymnoascus sp. 23342-1-I1]
MSNSVEQRTPSESDWEIVTPGNSESDESVRDEADESVRKDENGIQPASKADEIKAGSVKPGFDLTGRLSAPSVVEKDCDDNNKVVPRDANHSSANADLDKEERRDAIPMAEPNAGSTGSQSDGQMKRLVFRNIDVPPNCSQVNAKTESGAINWSGRLSEFEGFMNQPRATINGKWNVPGVQAAMEENANTITGPRIEKSPADVNAVDDESRHPLIVAIDSGFDELARTMVRNGADLTARDRRGRSALLMAIDKRFDELARLMVGNGAELDAVDHDGRHPLVVAIDSGFDELARTMVRNGADLTARDRRGRSALLMAIDKRFDELARLMVGNGAELDARRPTTAGSGS